MRLPASVYVVLGMSLAFHFFGDRLSGGQVGPFIHELEVFVASLGFLGYAAVVVGYAICAFLFIPVLIPLNIASGAMFGPYVGTGVALAAITAGSIASAVSVRHVFKGMQRFVESRPGADKVLEHIETRGGVVVLSLRLAFIVPYLWQNVLLALAPIGLNRLAVLTAVGSLPGAAVYCLLGAGIVRSDDLGSTAAFLGAPLVLLVVVSIAVKYLKRRYSSS